MIENRLHLSPLPAVNTKHLFYFPPHISSSVKVLKIRVPMGKHSFRDNCSIVLFILYYVLLTSICCVYPCLQPPMHRWVRPIGRWATSMARRASTDGSDPSTDGSDRPMARNIYTCDAGRITYAAAQVFRCSIIYPKQKFFRQQVFSRLCFFYNSVTYVGGLSTLCTLV